MASLVLSVVGSVFGGPLGGAIGAAIGGFIDRAIFTPTTKTRSETEGARLKSVNIMESTEGAPIPIVYGRTRVSGQIIWATKFLETIKTTTNETRTGGKGGGVGGGSSQTQVTKEYLYSCSVAVAIGEGYIGRMDRVWADGNLVDLAKVEDGFPIIYRYYPGTESQVADTHILSKEGADNSPGYRGTAYVVFENLLLKNFGNRIPQFTFEVTRNLGITNTDAMEYLVRAVTLIPASGEFVYSTQKITTNNGSTYYTDPYTHETTQTSAGVDGVDNKINTLQGADFPIAMDQMQQAMPYCNTVALVVGWFGDDLRADFCTIKPGIEDPSRTTKPLAWGVAGYDRASAHQVSQTNGKYNYGGTPSDNCVIEAIQHLKARGFRVIFYPFIFMDIPSGNTLPNPYSANSASVGQAVHPWRGRITCSPAAGQAGTVDKTAAAATQINSLFDNWYAPFITHYANLCVTAGGVHGFLIGSEYIGMSQVRSAAGQGPYPFVDKMVTLAATVKGIVGVGCKVGYAADWSEYNSHRPSDGSNDLIFNLDPLWSSSNIDFIGIDNYMPIADWRDGTSHLDYVPGRTIYDRDYLRSNIASGEGFDWFYASQNDRNGQVRTPITDGAYSKPWVYRQKDLKGWWTNYHVNRVGGTEVATTAWTPQSKQFWFTELGCPAIDKGANQPNSFYDPKSSESFFPYFSHGWRDDLMQRAFLEATMSYWFQTGTTYNPTSSYYGGPMVDPLSIFVWTWDARPFPFYPKVSAKWGDVANWDRGHWLNGRAGLPEAKQIIKDILNKQGFHDYNVDDVYGTVTGYVIDQSMSARQAIEPLGAAFFFDGIESNGKIIFRSRNKQPVMTIAGSDLVLGESDNDGNENPPFSVTRGQESELPSKMKLGYFDAAADYRMALAHSRRLSTTSKREAQSSLPFVMEQAEALGIAETLLIEQWAARETAKFVLPPNSLAVEPGDVVNAILDGKPWNFRITTISDSHVREAEAVATDVGVYQRHAGALRSYDGRLVLASGTTQSAGFTATRITSVSAGTNVISGSDLQFLQVGQPVYGVGVPPGTTITYAHPSGSYITVSNNITVTDPNSTISFGNQPPPNLPGGTTQTHQNYGSSNLVFLDLPILTGLEDPVQPYAVAYANPWKEQALLRSINGVSYTANQTLEVAGIMGLIQDPIPSYGVTGRWDNLTKIKVTLMNEQDQLLSKPDVDVLAGANVAFLEHQNYEWEVVQFATATLVGARTYELTRVLRGQAGTEHLAQNTIPALARFVFLSEALEKVGLAIGERNSPFYWKYGPVGTDQSDPAYQTVQRGFKGVGLRPYSPVNIRVDKVLATNDLNLSWMRRARKGGDDWNAAEIPLNEDFERYRVQVFTSDGVTLKRTEVIDASVTWVYTAANQVADFGAVQSQLYVKVSQYGPQFGDYGIAGGGLTQIRSYI